MSILPNSTNRRVDQVPTLIGLAHVGLADQRRPSAIFHVASGELEVLHASARDDDVGPVLGEQRGRGTPDAGTTPGNQGNLISEVEDTNAHAFSLSPALTDTG